MFSNANLKKLLSKGKLTPELLMEFKTSFFIHPLQKTAEDYILTSSNHENSNVYFLFTDMNEYLKTFPTDNDSISQIFYLNEFEEEFTDEISGVVINPATDSFFIPKSVILHIIEDINENNENLTQSNPERHEDYDNNVLHDYLKGKKTLRRYSKIFSYLDFAKIYVPVIVEDNIHDDKIPFDEVNEFYKKDDYFLLFTDLNMLEKQIDCKYYMVADCLDITKSVFEFDYNGIVLKTPEGDFTLERKNLLRYYGIFIKKYKLRENAHEFAYRLGDGHV